MSYCYVAYVYAVLCVEGADGLTVEIVNFIAGEKLGRRRTIWLAMTVVIIGATLQASAFTVAHLVVGRIITGVGTGLKTSTVPSYVFFSSFVPLAPSNIGNIATLGDGR